MRIFTILSVFLAAIPLCFSEPISLTQTPTTTAPATVTLPLGDDDVQSGWQVYPPDPQLLDDIPPSVLAHFDLMVRSMELDARAASKVYLLPLRCSDGGCINAPTVTNTPQGETILGENQKANFGFSANRIIFRGGKSGCHITFYELANEATTGDVFRIEFLTTTQTFSADVPFPSIVGQGPVTDVRSVGYFC